MVGIEEITDAYLSPRFPKYLLTIGYKTVGASSSLDQLSIPNKPSEVIFNALNYYQRHCEVRDSNNSNFESGFLCGNKLEAIELVTTFIKGENDGIWVK